MNTKIIGTPAKTISKNLIALTVKKISKLKKAIIIVHRTIMLIMGTKIPEHV
jgi:hypothetical protein